MKRSIGRGAGKLVPALGFLALFGSVVVLLLTRPLPDPPRNGVDGDFLIRDVAVVDVESGTVRHGQDVLVRGGRIASVGPAAGSPPGDAAVVIDGSGKYLMPGLWDMHAHSVKIAPQYMHPLFIANGVTGVRDMSGCLSEPDSFFACPDDRDGWNAALEAGRGLSPRYVLQGSFIVNGGREVPDGFPDFFRVRTAEDARLTVDFHRKAGADFLKVYSELPLDAYRWLADEARKQGFALAGHRPLRVSLEEMLAAGQRSVEHPRLFQQECYAGAATLRALPDPLAAYDEALRWRLIDEHDRERCAELMRAMAASETWWTPTLQVQRMSALAGDSAFRADRRLKYIPFLFRKLMWTPDADRAAQQLPDESGRELCPTLYRMALDHVGQAHAAGVKILAGTDAGDTYVFPGFSLHDELEELVTAGLSTAAALRAATLDAAVFARRERDFGSIAGGKVSDMLLLGADPLENVRNTRAIEGVFFNGQFLDRRALDALLDFAERQARSARTNLRLAWHAVTSPLFRVQLAD